MGKKHPTLWVTFSISKNSTRWNWTILNITWMIEISLIYCSITGSRNKTYFCSTPCSVHSYLGLEPISFRGTIQIHDPLTGQVKLLTFEGKLHHHCFLGWHQESTEGKIVNNLFGYFCFWNKFHTFLCMGFRLMGSQNGMDLLLNSKYSPTI